LCRQQDGIDHRIVLVSASTVAAPYRRLVVVWKTLAADAVDLDAAAAAATATAAAAAAAAAALVDRRRLLLGLLLLLLRRQLRLGCHELVRQKSAHGRLAPRAQVQLRQLSADLTRPALGRHELGV
jgi:hypothetical protein